jgi:pyruvate kinase
MSRLRFKIPMKAFTPDEAIRRRMSLTWGIESFLVERVTHTDAMYAQVDRVLLDEGLAELGDKVVVISGSPPGIPGSTNDLRVHVVGDAVNKVAPVWESGDHAD